MSRIEKEDVSVGSGIISSYQRMRQKLERVFAEFIDNSTQSFRDNIDKLKEISFNSVCRVSITWNENEIVIEDKSYGMNRDDFRRALKINSPKKQYSENSWSQFGMGLKIAAAYLGDWYSIESTQLGSKEKYYAVVDIKDWVKNNPKEIDNEITDVDENLHFTKITIRSLQKELTNSIDKYLRKKLSAIYDKDLRNGDLELYLNGISIQSVDPELWINEDTGKEYIKFIDDNFEFNNHEFNYNGWVGILKTASLDDAGFTLSQYGRGIILNYRPGEIFGKSNSFPYQRIVGEIQLDDPEWKVSFNKDNFIWDDGLEKAFLQSLKSNKDLKEMIDVAAKLRKPPKSVIKPDDIKKTAVNINNLFNGIDDPGKTIVKPYKPDKPVVVIEPEKVTDHNLVTPTWESVKYSFDIQVKNDDPTLPWFSLQKKSEDNSYYIILNGSLNYFQNYNNKQCKELIMSFAVTIALAQLSSVRRGIELKDSSLFINQINQIMKSMK